MRSHDVSALLRQPPLYCAGSPHAICLLGTHSPKTLHNF